MVCDVIGVKQWPAKRPVGLAIVRLALRVCRRVRMGMRPHREAAAHTRPKGAKCKDVCVRNELRLWPRPGAMC